MNMTIKSRKLKKDFTFFMPSEGGYITLESEGRPGTLGQQICRGGWFTGSTLQASSESAFKSLCRAWYRQHVKIMADIEY